MATRSSTFPTASAASPNPLPNKGIRIPEIIAVSRIPTLPRSAAEGPRPHLSKSRKNPDTPRAPSQHRPPSHTRGPYTVAPASNSDSAIHRSSTSLRTEVPFPHLAVDDSAETPLPAAPKLRRHPGHTTMPASIAPLLLPRFHD